MKRAPAATGGTDPPGQTPPGRRRWTRLLVTCGALVGVSFGAATPARAAFAAVMAVSPSGLPGGQIVYPPQVGIDARGDAIAAWEEQLPGEPPRFTVAERPAGARGWGAGQVLAPSGTGSGDPEAALAMAPSGAAVVAFQSSPAHGEDLSAPSVIMASDRDPRTGVWSVPTQISTHDPSWVGVHPKVAIDGRGQAVVGWEQFQPFGNANVDQVATFDPTTAAWSAPVTLPSPSFSNPPEVAIDGGGDTAAVWDDRVRGNAIFGPTGATAKVSAAVKPARASRWIVTRTLGTEAFLPGQLDLTVEAPGPQIALDARGDALVIWQGHSPRHTVTDTATWNPRARRWSHPNPLVRTVASWPHIAVTPEGRATVVWLTASGSLEAASRPVLGCCFTKPATLTGHTGFANHPQIAVNQAGDAIAIWSGARFHAVVRDARTGRWHRPITLGRSTDSYGLNAGGAVALNAAGQGIVAWPEDPPSKPPVSDMLIDSAFYSG